MLIGGAAAWPLSAHAQQRERARRIGVVTNLAADDAESKVRIAAFVQRLQGLGWTDGRNVRIDHRWSAGDASEFPDTLPNRSRSRRTSFWPLAA
jgi:putative ABC transport system substrate-binding protein